MRHSAGLVQAAYQQNSALELKCQECGALLRLVPAQRTATCFYCRSPNVVESASDPTRVRPRFALAFVLPPEVALERARAWQRGLGWFRGKEIRKAPLGDLHAVYTPAFLYSAVARSGYRVEIGETYTTGSGDNRRTHTEWRPLAGEHATFVRDIVVSASRGIPNLELERIEPYDMRALHRYTAALISGWPAEEPSQTPAAVWQEARAEAMQHVDFYLRRFMPGDTHRGLQFNTQLSYESLDLLLLPLWVLPVRVAPGVPPVRLLINGQTGRIYGPAPLAWGRVVLVIALGLGVVVGLFLLLIAVGMLLS
ncbi:MAG: hypothetical protein R3B07_32425 [Polyangiaceae bacterium]